MFQNRNNKVQKHIVLFWTQISILIIFNYVILTRVWYDLNSYLSYSLRISVCDWLDILSTYAMLCDNMAIFIITTNLLYLWLKVIENSCISLSCPVAIKNCSHADSELQYMCFFYGSKSLQITWKTSFTWMQLSQLFLENATEADYQNKYIDL